MIAQRKQGHTAQEYFLHDQQSSDKLEYYAGYIVAQAGSTARHNLITANFIGHLYAPVRTNGCQVFPSDMRVQAIDQRVYTYPDLTIVCGTPQYAEPGEMTLLNPTVIIEILSPSTQAKDRKEKLEYYRTIESLQAYILVAQDAPYVQYYTRQTPHFWYVNLVDDMAATIEIAAINATISMQAIYTGITFSRQ